MLNETCCNIALYIIKKYNDEVNKVFPTYCKEFECGAEDFYMTKTKLNYLLLLIQGLYFNKYEKEAFYENIYISSSDKFEVYIDEVKRIYQPLVAVNDDKVFFINREYYIPSFPNKELQEVIDKVLNTWGGYEEWYIKSVIKEFDCVRKAKDEGSFRIDIPTLAVDIQIAHNKESQGRWEDDEWS